ncbi:MAG TPA: NAD(P)-dependent alcohol dehydrogenase [Mycobacterium sp.]|nr:NAD(P)-dependent alcohol dehydrogenase [Mycobacterium sp.]
MRITAAVSHPGHDRFVLEEVELAGPRPGEALVRIAGVGMCHTDIAYRTTLPHPAILGHEGAGVIQELGAGVTGFRPGDHVVLTFDSCGACGNCLDAMPAYCDGFSSRNMSALRPDGSSATTGVGGRAVGNRWFGQSSFAQYCLATTRNMVPVPDDLPLATAGPLGCGVQTGAGAVLVGMRVEAGTSIAIFGAGAVGLSAVMAARVAGAARIIAVDLHESRRLLALELGATEVHDGADPELVERIAGDTGGVHYAFDTTGNPSVIRTALRVLRPLGLCGLVGVGDGELVLPQQWLGAGRRLANLREGNVVAQTFIPRLVRLWRQGRFPFERLVSTYGLEEINDAVADSLSGVAVKPVVLPTAIEHRSSAGADRGETAEIITTRSTT